MFSFDIYLSKFSALNINLMLLLSVFFIVIIAFRDYSQCIDILHMLFEMRDLMSQSINLLPLLQLIKGIQ